MKKFFIAILMVAISFSLHSQGIGIGTNNPNSSAILDLSSSNKGVLFPRMSTTQRNAIMSPATGLTIFNTDDQCTDIYDGANWIKNCGLKQIDSVAIPANSWMQLHNFSGVARTDAVAFSIANKGYIGGGLGSSGYLTDFWEFDPTTGAWSQKAGLAQLGKTGGIGFSILDKGYVGTGRNGSVASRDFWEYDPSSNTWLQRTDFGGSGRENAVGFSIGNKGYLGTGFDGTVDLNDFWEFDPATNSWTQKANFFFNRSNAVGFSIGNKGYVGTGTTSFSTDLYVYDPATNSWGPTASSGGPARSYAVGFSIGNKGYVGLGIYAGGGGAMNDFWEYDPAANSWSQKTNFSGTARYDAIGFAIGSKGYIGTGVINFAGTAEFWEYRSNSYMAAAYSNPFSQVNAGQLSDGIWTKSFLSDQPYITTAGLVGININDPRFSLDVKGPLRLRSQGAKTAGVWLNNIANTDTTVFMGMMDDNTAGFYSNGNWGWIMNSPTGNIGIGTTNPVTKLHVVGTSFFNGNVGIGVSNPSAPLHVNGTTILNGNVGIGAVIPVFPLTIQGSVGGDKISLGGNTVSAPHYGLGIQSGLLQLYSDVISSDIAFGYGRSGSFTERMRIKGSGNVGIGTTNPAQLFEIAGPASASPVTLVIGNKGGFGPAALEFVSDYGVISNQWRPGYIRSNDIGGFTGSLEFYTNGTGSGNLYGNVKGLEVRNGVTYTSTGTVSSWSDARLKQNIQPFTAGLDVINKINPVSFYYNNLSPFNTPKQQVGIIAQELEKVAPYMVDKTSTREINDLRSVNNQAYVFLLINAVKELATQNDKQQKQIEVLQKLVEQLLKDKK